MLTLIVYLGLSYWAFSDWRYQAVPAAPFDAWCLAIIGYQFFTGWPWWPPLLWWLGFGLLAWAGWLGSADAWLIGVFASLFPFLSLLWLLLIACCTGLAHAYFTHRHQLPWLPHLAFAAVIVQWLF